MGAPFLSPQWGQFTNAPKRGLLVVLRREAREETALTLVLFSGRGGQVVLPAEGLVLVDREDGGHLCVNPPREVWERTELTPEELTQWSFLVASSARAMLEALPVLRGGCINYWEAGNWSLNHAAEPKGGKDPRAHRRVHLHLLGRSPTARSASWRWGEAPTFPDFIDRHRWSAGFRRLTAEECGSIVGRLRFALSSKYGVPSAGAEGLESACPGCGYPVTAAVRPLCGECEVR
jgi:diadenosine tetraphosphate (Ap4A) HIT family hydrolase